DNLFEWTAVITSSEVDSPYEGGKFKLAINVPSNYPLQPPNMKFISKVCHPNVHFNTGEICLDLLKSSWSP
ncbi:UBC-like protein, partial [Rhizoclosmatium globosum]